MISNGALDNEMYGVSPFQQVNNKNETLVFNFRIKFILREEHLSPHHVTHLFIIIIPVIPNHR
jgi:hypothetical protein